MIDRIRVGFLAVVAVALVSGALGQDKPLTGKDLLFWKANWPRISRYYVQVGNEFFACVTYQNAYPSSAHQTVASWIGKNSTVRKVKVGFNLSKNVRDVPPKEEGVAAAATIPALKPGLYGHIHSAQVEKVVGPNRMIVSSIWFVDQKETYDLKNAEQKKLDKFLWEERQKLQAQQDRDRDKSRRRTIQNIRRVDSDQYQQQLDEKYKIREQRIKEQGELKTARVLLVGFPTGGVIPGKRWTGQNNTRQSPYGPQIAVTGELKEEGYDPNSYIGRRKKLTVAINANLFKNSRIDEEAFRSLLKQRGVSPAQFVALGRKVFAEVREKAREDEQAENGIEYNPGRPQPHLVLALESIKGKSKLPDPSAVAEVKPSDTPADETKAEEAEADKTKQTGLKWFGSGNPKKSPKTTTPTASEKTKAAASETPKQPAAGGDADQDDASAKPSSAGLKWFKSKTESKSKPPATDGK